MYILGINGGVRIGYQDVAASLVKDGKVIFAVEEERLNRIKFSPGQLPERAIRQCLDFEGISMRDIDIVATHGSTWGDTFKKVLSAYLRDNFGHCPELFFVHHHDAHAASAFYGSGFYESMILTMDASGDGVSTQLSVGKANDIAVEKRYSRPNSLGIFYTMITQICGFRRDSDEYKLMGLSAYGDPGKYDLSPVLKYSDNAFHLNEKYIKSMKPGEPQPTKQEMIYSDELTDFLGRRRLPGEAIEQKHKDMAASGQRQLENVVISMIRDFYESTGIRKLCLAGGVAQNCLLNQKLMNLDFIDDIYVQPASSDAGISAGGAMYASVSKGIPVQPMHSALLGLSYSDEEIEKVLKHIKIKYRKLKDPAKTAAELISDNKIIGWFQGRMEFGPRALGARSILANPSMPGVKEALNSSIKYREAYRPFCPSVTEEDMDRYFTGKAEKSPFMNITFDVRDDKKDDIQGVVHADGTARVQTVSQAEQPEYHRLLKYVQEFTGHPVVVNTSFNTNNEPIVASPADAVATFYRSGLDALVIGGFLIEK